MYIYTQCPWGECSQKQGNTNHPNIIIVINCIKGTSTTRKLIKLYFTNENKFKTMAFREINQERSKWPWPGSDLIWYLHPQLHFKYSPSSALLWLLMYRMGLILYFSQSLFTSVKFYFKEALRKLYIDSLKESCCILVPNLHKNKTGNPILYSRRNLKRSSKGFHSF